MMKRTAVCIAALILAITCLFVVSSAADEETGTYRVTATGGVNLYQYAYSSSNVLRTVRKDVCLTILSIENGYGYTVYDSVYGYVDLSTGLTYVRSDPYVATDGTVEGLVAITVISEPDKLEYIDGEESADVTGLSVGAVFSDGTIYEITGYAVAFPSLTDPGVKVVTVYYAGYTDTFFITVVRVPLSGITITSEPYVTDYIEGETISFDGLEITASYTDGREDEVVTDYEISGLTEGETAEAGVYTVTVTYKYSDITAQFTVGVANKSLVSLKLDSLPSSTTIYQYSELDLDDVTMTAVYDNGTSVTVTSDDFVADYDNVTVGSSIAKLYYDGMYAAFDIEVLERTETGIDIVIPDSTSCYVGGEVDTTGLIVYVTYNSGVTEPTDDYTVSYTFDTSVPGSYRVYVYHGSFSVFYEFTVLDSLLGDANLDGSVTLADARLALRAILLIENLSDEGLVNCDVNGDEVVSLSDTRLILRYVLGLGTITGEESEAEEESSEA